MDFERGLTFSEEQLNYLAHYGIKRRSGRYPWGSGDSPYQHSGDFLSRVEEMRKAKVKYVDEDGREWTGDNAIAKIMGMSTTDFRTANTVANEERRSLLVARAKSLRDDGLSLNAIAAEMGFKNDSSVRSLLKEDSAVRMNQSKETAETLKKIVAEKGMVDVGEGVEKYLGVSKERLDQALFRLGLEGYEVYGGRVPQVNNPGKQTTLQVLCPPGTEHKQIFNYGEIGSAYEYTSLDGGDTFQKYTYPKSLDSKRLMVRYDEDGGTLKDGIIEIRRGVDDLSLGGKRYAQCRILVDDNKYIKGMAVYSDDMPDGVDIIFNTNKSKAKYDKLSVLKDIKREIDGTPAENPFGSSIKPGGQLWYTDKNGKQQLSPINRTRDEGDWSDWKDKLPSQFLSKQSLQLAKKQLNLAIAEKQKEYDDICSLTNPTIKKQLLETFANDCDSSAVHLHAAALPRQKYHVIIPVNSLKDNEIYAPKYRDGEQVALVRYPHGGTFEIPVLTVNNKHRAARKLLGSDIEDAVGITSKVAERLSGADFDGDTVMVIPTNEKVKITSTKELDGLKGFDPKLKYATEKRGDDYYNARGEKIKVMANTQNEMGRISNLITDMTIKGAKQDELARAVRHSMVVIDAEKHKLDYKSSYKENGIDELKKAYQEGGASTLLSRAKSEVSVDKRRGTPSANIKGTKNYDPDRPEGALIYKTAYDKDLYRAKMSTSKKTGMITVTDLEGNKYKYHPDDPVTKDLYKPRKRVLDDGSVEYTDKTGKIKYVMEKRKQASTRMAETDDAYTLVSDHNTAMERYYADYANKMKSMANSARKEIAATGKIAYDPVANKEYAEEVNSLKKKVNDAEKNRPRERQAQLIANSVINAKKQENPDMTKEEIKKLGQRELNKARAIVGAKRNPIIITDREWAAIQSGAVSENVLKNILKSTDIDSIRQRATPKSTTTLSTAKVNRIKSLKAQGKTLSEIADAVGVSTSTVSKYLNGKE